MRTRTQFKKISITSELYDRLKKEKENFQEKIDGGKWSFSDTIWEFMKIAGNK